MNLPALRQAPALPLGHALVCDAPASREVVPHTSLPKVLR